MLSELLEDYFRNDRYNQIADFENSEVYDFLIWNKEKYPDANTYLNNVIKTHKALIYLKSQSDLTEKLIKNVEEINKLTKQTDSTLINYFFKNWIGNFITIYEVSLLLINDIYELGYVKREACKSNIQKDDIFNKDKKLKKLTSVINKLVWSETSGTGLLLEINNLIKHKGEFNNSTINEMSQVEREYMINLLFDENPDEIDYKIDKGVIKNTILKEITTKNLEMTNAVLEFTNYLASIFKEKFEEKRKGYEGEKVNISKISIKE